MYLKLWIIDEIDDRDSCAKDCRLNCSDQKTRKNPLHLLMLATCPWRNERDTILEVSEAWVSWHTAKACVYFFLTSDLKTPIDEMIFEDSLMKLMEKVGGKTGKYVGMWKVYPERIIDWSNPFICKTRKSASGDCNR